MPLFTYVGDAGLYYPYLEGGRTPEPGSEHELAAAPTDGRWHDAAGNVVVEPAPEPEPVVDAPVVKSKSTRGGN